MDVNAIEMARDVRSEYLRMPEFLLEHRPTEEMIDKQLAELAP